MPTAVATKPERKKADPPASILGAMREENLAVYRGGFWAAAKGENFDREDVAAIMLANGLTDAHWESDVTACRDFLGLGDFEKTYEAELSRLNAQAANPEVVEIKADLLSAVFRKMQSPSASLLNVPRELTAAIARYRGIAPQIQSLMAQVKTLRAFKSYNQRMFASDPQVALADKRPSITLADVDRMAALPAGFSRIDELPNPHPFCARLNACG